MEPVIALEEVELYQSGQECLNIPSLVIEQGERIQITGLNGSGKTTLLQLLSGLLVPDQGKLTVLNQQSAGLSSHRRSQFRADHMGYVFQSPMLVPYLNALENILLPCRLSPVRRMKLNHKLTTPNYEAYQLMAALKMENPEQLRQPINRLSPGQQQRVAVARALIGDPELILCDEAARVLDPIGRHSLYEALLKSTRQRQQTLVCIDHERHPGFDRWLDMSEINLAQRVDQLW